MPINVGIVGLNASSWASWSHVPALKHPRVSSKYTIIALCNSSAESALKAAEQFNIPASKAYHNITDMANDNDVDLVVVSVKVPYHKELVMAAIVAGKDVFCEWPLGNGLKEAEEMSEAAKKKNVRTIVGLQGRAIGVVQKAKELVAEGAIGEILSTTVHGSEHFTGGPQPEVQEYLLDLKNGANLLTICSSHILDCLTFVLGSEFASLSAITTVRTPEVAIVEAAGNALHENTDKPPKVLRTVQRNSPDQVLVNGTLSGTGVPVSAHIWIDQAKKSHFYWRIAGSKGYLEFRGDMALFLTEHGPKLYMSVNGEEAKEIEVKEDGNYLLELYDAFANGEEGKYAKFEDAVVRHRMVETIQQSSAEGIKKGYEGTKP